MELVSITNSNARQEAPADRPSVTIVTGEHLRLAL